MQSKHSFPALELASCLAGLCLLITTAAAQPAAQPRAQQPGVETVMQSAPTGRLTVRAVLASEGKTTPVPGAEAHIHLFHNNKPFKEIKVLLDEQGSAVVADIPVVMGVVPLVRVQYQGLTYQETGRPLDAATRDGTIEVKVYESTEDTPAWRIPMRHLMIKPGDASATVTELVIVDNPSQKTWLGKDPDEKGNRATVDLCLPEGAREVTLESGFHGWCCTSLQGRVLRVRMPMMPGQARFRFSYSVPAGGGAASIGVTSPVPVDHMMFLLPDDGSPVTPAADTAELSPSVSGNGPSRARIYSCNNLAPDRAVGLLVSAPPPTTTAPASSTQITTWVVTGGVLTLGVVIGLVVRGRRGRKPEPRTA